MQTQSGFGCSVTGHCHQYTMPRPRGTPDSSGRCATSACCCRINPAFRWWCQGAPSDCRGDDEVVKPASGCRSLAWQRDFAGARDFLHAERIHQADKFLHLAFGAGDFDGEAFGLHIHDFGAENVRDLHHLGARF